ncbi:TonB-dependent receptor domain-containing protein [Alistipes indistinctus]|uniref:TonB-dependent receptor domain-containing protein n=1 Tax=Alistipes indistinctus TaxID=626932 RepID=UPI003521C1A4
MSNDPHLTWEKKKTVDVGLDFRLWDRFYGTLDWYQTNTTDMIWAAPISFAMSNTETLGQNTAEMRTRGFELELGVDIIKTPDILWSFAVNGAHYRSVLTKVPPGTGSDALNGCWTADADAWALPVLQLRLIQAPSYVV